MELKGARGRLLWGFYQAARVDGYAVRHDRETNVVTLTGTLAELDTFKLTQTPITFEAQVGTACWRWTCLSLTVTGDRVRATLGVRETWTDLSAQTSVH